MDCIQVPVHDWFHSRRLDELYHSTDRVFEAYPHQEPTSMLHTTHSRFLTQSPTRFRSLKNRMGVGKLLHVYHRFWNCGGM